VDDTNTVKKRWIHTGPVLENRFVVKSGLDEGERIIIQGLQKVQPDMKVQTRSTEDKEDS
jgi:hypothetical protein